MKCLPAKASKSPPARRPSLLEDGGRAIGIVEVKNRRLRLGVGGTTAVGVLGISLDLGWPPFVALDQDGEGDAGAGHRGRVKVGQSRDDSLGTLGVGKSFQLRPAAAGHTGQAQ